jgi:hypothetical protein
VAKDSRTEHSLPTHAVRLATNDWSSHRQNTSVDGHVDWAMSGTAHVDWFPKVNFHPSSLLSSEDHVLHNLARLRRARSLRIEPSRLPPSASRPKR